MDRTNAMTEFTLGDDEYQVVRYAAPETKEDWVMLIGTLLGCSAADASVAYDAMFPQGYDPVGTGDVALMRSDERWKSEEEGSRNE